MLCANQMIIIRCCEACPIDCTFIGVWRAVTNISSRSQSGGRAHLHRRGEKVDAQRSPGEGDLEQEDEYLLLCTLQNIVWLAALGCLHLAGTLREYTFQYVLFTTPDGYFSWLSKYMQIYYSG
jgi:hypothetical protein